MVSEVAWDQRTGTSSQDTKLWGRSGRGNASRKQVSTSNGQAEAVDEKYEKLKYVTPGGNRYLYTARSSFLMILPSL